MPDQFIKLKQAVTVRGESEIVRVRDHRPALYFVVLYLGCGHVTEPDNSLPRMAGDSNLHRRRHAPRLQPRRYRPESASTAGHAGEDPDCAKRCSERFQRVCSYPEITRFDRDHAPGRWLGHRDLCTVRRTRPGRSAPDAD